MTEDHTDQKPITLTQYVAALRETDLSVGEKLTKLEETAKAWNVGVRKSQKVTLEEIEKAKKELGIS